MLYNVPGGMSERNVDWFFGSACSIDPELVELPPYFGGV
jgi:hypothetical protein